MSNNNVHCIKGTIPFLFGWFNREVIVCQNYNPTLDIVHYDGAFNELKDTPGFIMKEEYYLQNGLYHRLVEFGPAYFEYLDHTIIKRAYYKNGLLHREDGPATLYNKYECSYKKYFLDGIEQTHK